MQCLYYYTVNNWDNYIVSTGLTDWCVPEGAEICPREITDTAFYYDEVLKVGKICQVLGEDGEYYFKLAEKIKNAFRERFVNDDCIGDGGQASYATAIYNGLLHQSVFFCGCVEWQETNGCGIRYIL